MIISILKKNLTSFKSDNLTLLLIWFFNLLISFKFLPKINKSSICTAIIIFVILLDKIRAILFTAKLNIKFWAEALDAAVYIYNKTPHTALNFITPYEKRFNKKPNIDNLKI